MESVQNRVFDVLIVGAGISGIGAAIRLREAGLEDFVILEKADSVGGTWRDNTYPGCACDVPSALYSYSFFQSARWSRMFAGQAEILAYVEETATRFTVTGKIQFGQSVEEAWWDEGAGCWQVRTGDRRYRSRFVISCGGYLHEPKLPDLPGLSAFPGTVFHSSRWDHDHDLAGRRVAVIGTGASAIQFVPQIQPKVEQLYVFQRTPQWILPKLDTKMGLPTRALLTLPGATNAFRGMLHQRLEKLGGAFRHPEHMKKLEEIALGHMHKAIVQPELRAKLTPDYVLGCKRVLLSNDYYPAIAKPNVELLATGVTEIRGRTVVGQGGKEREVDTIILGTGFHVADPPIAKRIRGADGRTLAEVWNGSPEAYRGTTMAGFPNAFMVLGPNLAIGHNSAFIVIEAQLDYIVDALRTARRNGFVRVEVQEGVQRTYNADVQEGLRTTVWNTGGCSSYYIDDNGRNSVAFPWSTNRMRRLLARFDVENYDVATERTVLSGGERRESERVPSRHATGKKRALVIGCGGVLGAAWTIAALAEVERQLGWDARSADVLVGTSSGAIIAALLGAGVSVHRMVRSQRGELADDCWDHEKDYGVSRPPKSTWPLTAPGLVVGALRSRTGAVVGLSGLAPRGRMSTEPIGRLVETAAGGDDWVAHPSTWLMVVDAASGQRVALGRDGAPRVPIGLAARASYAIPGWCEPITWDGATYLDGGIASPTSADFLLGSGVDEAIVLAPMASRAPVTGRTESGVERAMRRHMTRIVEREVAALGRAGVRVVRLEPWEEALTAFGANMMSVRRRRHVFDVTEKTAEASVVAAVADLLKTEPSHSGARTSAA